MGGTSGAAFGSPEKQGAPPGSAGVGDDLRCVTYKECMRRAEVAIASITTCDDVDEHVRLVREAEKYIREAQARIEAAEGDIQRILAGSAA